MAKSLANLEKKESCHLKIRLDLSHEMAKNTTRPIKMSNNALHSCIGKPCCFKWYILRFLLWLDGIRWQVHFTHGPCHLVPCNSLIGKLVVGANSQISLTHYSCLKYGCILVYKSHFLIWLTIRFKSSVKWNVKFNLMSLETVLVELPWHPTKPTHAYPFVCCLGCHLACARWGTMILWKHFMGFFYFYGLECCFWLGLI